MGGPGTKKPNNEMVIRTADPSQYGLGDKAPPLAPDLTDEQVQAARMRQLRKLMSGRGRSSTFLGEGEAGALPFRGSGKSALGGE